MTAALVPELYVSDFDRSLDFYTRRLGFSIAYQRPDERFAYLARDGAELMIEQPGERVWLCGTLSYPYGRGVSLQIATAGVAALYDALESTVKIFLPLEQREYRRHDDIVTVLKFVLLDPDGYLLRFSETIGMRPI